MKNQSGQRSKCVEHADASELIGIRILTIQKSRIANLTAGFGVVWRVAQDDQSFFACAQFVDLLFVLYDCDDLRVIESCRVVTVKLTCSDLLGKLGIHRTDLRLSFRLTDSGLLLRSLQSFVESRIEIVLFKRNAFLLEIDAGQVTRRSVRVVQFCDI